MRSVRRVSRADELRGKSSGCAFVDPCDPRPGNGGGGFASGRVSRRHAVLAVPPGLFGPILALASLFIFRPERTADA